MSALTVNKLKKIWASKEVTFLGYHMINVNREKYKNIYNKESNDVIIESLNKDIYLGGTFNYTINKNGAKKLLDYIENNGIKHGIDFLMKIFLVILMSISTTFEIKFWNGWRCQYGGSV